MNKTLLHSFFNQLVFYNEAKELNNQIKLTMRHIYED